MTRRLLAVALVVVSACGALDGQHKDGGASTGGGFGGGGASAGGGSGGGGADAGGGGGGLDAGLDAGGGGGGGLAQGPFIFGTVGLTGSTSGLGLVGVSGEPGNVWVVQESGHTFRSTGGAFAHVLAFSYAQDIFARGSTVVVLQTRTIRTCTNGTCAADADYATFNLLTSSINHFGTGLCGRSATDLYMVGTDSSNVGVLYHFDGQTWALENQALPISGATACWVDGSDVYVSGTGGAARVSGGAAYFEAAGTNASATFYGGAAVDGVRWLVGDSASVYRHASSGWVLASSDTSTGTFHGIAAPTSLDAFVFANQGGSVPGLHCDGVAWQTATALPGFGSGYVRGATAVSPHEIYFVGENSSGPVVVRGSR